MQSRPFIEFFNVDKKLTFLFYDLLMADDETSFAVRRYFLSNRKFLLFDKKRSAWMRTRAKMKMSCDRVYVSLRSVQSRYSLDIVHRRESFASETLF